MSGPVNIPSVREARFCRISSSGSAKSSIVIATLALMSCSPGSDRAAEEEREAEDPVMSCVQRGVAYFKEIGSYPTLQSAPNTGRAAEDVALERCQRTTGAF